MAISAPQIGQSPDGILKPVSQDGHCTVGGDLGHDGSIRLIETRAIIGVVFLLSA